MKVYFQILFISDKGDFLPKALLSGYPFSLPSNGSDFFSTHYKTYLKTIFNSLLYSHFFRFSSSFLHIKDENFDLQVNELEQETRKICKSRGIHLGLSSMLQSLIYFKLDGFKNHINGNLKNEKQ